MSESEEIKFEIIEYAAQICAQFEKFKKRCGYTAIQIDRRIAVHAAKSWQDDLKRYQDYHSKCDELSPYKQLAYLMYWLAKSKPIFFPHGHLDPKFIDPKYHEFDYCAINEVFAFTLCIDLLRIDTDDMNLSVYNEMYKRFRYDLYYRDICPKQLFTTLELLHKALTSPS